MEKDRIKPDISGKSVHNRILLGDRFEGICISDYIDQTYDFEVDGKKITVVQKVSRPRPDRMYLGFLFLLEEPVRFRIDTLIPSDCVNARVALRDQVLISYFSDQFPDDPEALFHGNCHDAEIPYSTLKPGEFQSINFRWESGDVLTFYFYYERSCEAPSLPRDDHGKICK